MASQALQSIRRTVTVTWPAHAQANAKSFLIRTAHAGHAVIMADAAKRGSIPSFEAYANSPGRRVEDVILPGPIVYRYRYLAEVAIAGLKMLRESSPVDSGRYRNSHMAYVDGVSVTTIPTSLKPGSSIWLSNPLVYSRRLEIGKTESGRSFLVSVPNRIYERTAKSLKTRYGRTAKITFGYITPSNAQTLVNSNPGRGRRHATRGHRAGDVITSPAIFIEALT